MYAFNFPMLDLYETMGVFLYQVLDGVLFIFHSTLPENTLQLYGVQCA